MSDNNIFALAACIALAAHLAVPAWVLRSRTGLRAMLCLNAAVAVPVLAYQVSRLPYASRPVDGQIVALVAFEVVAIASAAWAFRGGRLPAAIAYVVFVLHLCASAAAVAFVLTFRLDRLI